MLADAVAGELIQSEIEIRSGRGEDLADAVARQREARARLFRLAADRGALLAATGTHPWSPWQEQRIIDTDHYHRVEQDLQYVAWRNNTFSVHVHVGVRGADRAVAVCDRLRAVLPSCWRSRPTRRSSTVATPACTRRAARSSPRASPAAGSPSPSGASAPTPTTWTSCCERTRSWSTPSSGGVCARTMPSARWRSASATRRRRAEDSTALAGLITACVAQAALDIDEGVPYEPPPGRFVEENFWRAIRYGLEGRLIDLDRAEEFPAAAIGDRLLAWTAPARAVARASTWPCRRERRPAPAPRCRWRARRSRRCTRPRWPRRSAPTRRRGWRGERAGPGRPAAHRRGAAPRGAPEPQGRRCGPPDRRDPGEHRRAAAHRARGEGQGGGAEGDRGRAGAAAALPRGGGGAIREALSQLQMLYVKETDERAKARSKIWTPGQDPREATLLPP